MRWTSRVCLVLTVAVVASACSSGTASTKSGILVDKPGSYPGDTLFAPHTTTTTYLVDEHDTVVHTWAASSKPALSVRLLEDGTLLRPAQTSVDGPFAHEGGHGGLIQLLAWDGRVIWSYEYASAAHLQHHDADVLPNGDVIFIAWEVKKAPEALRAGRLPSLLPQGELWPDSLIEVNPTTGQIVWEWHVWDHLIQDRDPTKDNYGVVADHPEKIDINYTTDGGIANWNHTNSVDYNPALDEILVSVRQFSEVWIINHATTTDQARGPAGDLLYRWGNPAAYDHGTKRDQQLFRQHDAAWIPRGLPGAGGLTIFNNGGARGYSSADEIVPVLVSGKYEQADDQTYLPRRSHRIYPRTTDQRFYSVVISGAQRLPNGNTLITDGVAGHIIEVTAAGRVVWEYVSPYRGARASDDTKLPSNRIFRARRYGLDYPGLAAL